MGISVLGTLRLFFFSTGGLDVRLGVFHVHTKSLLVNQCQLSVRRALPCESAVRVAPTMPRRCVAAARYSVGR